MKAKQVTNVINKHIDCMFGELAKEYKLKYGDFAPEQEDSLDKIKDDLYFLLKDYINNNRK
jgi:hypothetical protein